jgi:hypothetical protein
MPASESKGALSPANWARKIAGPFMVFIRASLDPLAGANLGALAAGRNGPVYSELDNAARARTLSPRSVPQEE